MTLSNSISACAIAIKGLISAHANISGNSDRKGHVQAGGVPQRIGSSLSAGTDNGYYARADHVHTVQTNYIKDTNTYNNLDISANATQAQINSAINTKIGQAINYINR